MSEIYRNALAGPRDLAGFRMEGDGVMSFPQGRLRLESLRPASEGQAANLVLWCPEEFPADVRVEWEFWPVREPGLAIMFFHARGRAGEDLFDPALAGRDGPYEQYHHGDIDAYHVSYFRRRWASERALHICNLRKSHGFHLVAQGADPLPGVMDAEGPYAMRIDVAAGAVTFSINDLVSFRWEDDGSIGGPALAGGKIGFRQMAPLIGEYANLRVSRH
ncbi:DUF1961 family protein [Nonomuraea sp. NPDC004297]